MQSVHSAIAFLGDCLMSLRAVSTLAEGHCHNAVNRWSDNKETRKQRWIRLFITFLLCCHFTLSYSAEIPYLHLQEYTVGASPFPYQYRVLPMFFLRLLVPLRIIGRIAAHFPVGNATNVRHLLVLAILVLICIFIAVLTTAASLEYLTGDPIFSKWMSLIVIYMSYFNLAPVWGLNYTFPYDVPSLALFCTAVYLVMRDRTALFYLVFALATLTRETSCFLTLFFDLEVVSSPGVAVRTRSRPRASGSAGSEAPYEAFSSRGSASSDLAGDKVLPRSYLRGSGLRGRSPRILQNRPSEEPR